MKKFLASGVLAYFLAFNLASAQNVLDSGTRGIIPAPVIYDTKEEELLLVYSAKLTIQAIDAALEFADEIVPEGVAGAGDSLRKKGRVCLVDKDVKFSQGTAKDCDSLQQSEFNADRFLRDFDFRKLEQDKSISIDYTDKKTRANDAKTEIENIISPGGMEATTISNLKDLKEES